MRNIRAGGTIRENRIAGASKSMASSKALSKKSCNNFDYRCDRKMLVWKWNDSSVVNVASNYFTQKGGERGRKKL